MMLTRGMRANLQMSSTGEVKSIIVVVMCSRNGKACTKNPSIKNNCPFVMYFIRKSALIDKDTHRVNDNYSISINPRGGQSKKRVIPPYHPMYNVPVIDDDDESHLVINEPDIEDDDEYRRCKYVDDKYSMEFKQQREIRQKTVVFNRRNK